MPARTTRTVKTIARTTAVLVLAAALTASALASFAAQDLPAPGSVHGDIVLTPTDAVLPGGQRIESDHVLARALEWAAPGARILLQTGDYPPLGIGHASARTWNSKGAGGTSERPVKISARGRVRIVAGDQSDALTVHQQTHCAHIHFERVEFVAGYRAAVLFSDVQGEVEHRGFHFYDCSIDGAFDHRTGAGVRSKWGVLGHDLADFVFAGRDGRASVRNTCHEHAFYLQNPRGDLTIERVDASELGRTFVQITGRERSGIAGRGLVRIVDNNVRDIGLAAGDGYKGGTAFTFSGRLEGCTILVEGNTYRAGFEPALLRLTTESQPYGTAALVAWDEKSRHYNGTLVLRGNDFEMARGVGDRALVTIGATRRVIIDADNRFVSGGTWPALNLDPVDKRGVPTGPLNGAVQIDEGVRIQGDFLVAGAPVTDAQRIAFAVPLADR